MGSNSDIKYLRAIKLEAKENKDLAEKLYALVSSIPRAKLRLKIEAMNKLHEVLKLKSMG